MWAAEPAGAGGLPPRTGDASQPAAGSQRLIPGARIGDALPPESTHSYEVALEQGEVLGAVLDQGEFDLRAVVSGPDGQRLAVFDGTWHGPEWVQFSAPASSVFQIQVEWAERLGVRAPYELRIEHIGPGGDVDATRSAALQHATRGKELATQGGADPLRAALSTFEDALARWRLLDDRFGQAQTLNTLGFLRIALGEPRAALEHLTNAIDIWPTVGYGRGLAQSLHNVAAAYSALGEARSALDTYRRSLAAWDAAGGRRGRAQSLASLAVVEVALGDLDASVEASTEALTLYRTFGDRRGELQALINMGAAQLRLAETQRALAVFREVLRVARELGDRRAEAVTLNNIASAHLLLRETDQAIVHLNDAIRQLRALGDERSAAQALTNLARAFHLQGQLTEARRHYQEALAVGRAIEDRQLQALVLTNLGHVAQLLGDNDAGASAAIEAMGIASAIGDAYLEAAGLNNLARIRREQGEILEAIALLERALSLATAVGDPDEHATILLNLARAGRQLHRLEMAREHLSRAVELVESIRSKVTRQDLRVLYFASRREIYDEYVDLLMELHSREPTAGFDHVALDVSERARGRSLADSLIEASADIRKDVDPALLAREGTARRRINELAASLIRLIRGPHTPAQEADLRRALESAVTAYEDLTDEIRARSPQYAALTQPVSLRVDQIQREVLDEHTALLAYWVAERRSYLWAVTRASVRSFVLPPAAEIVAAASELVREIEASGARVGAPDGRWATLSETLLGPAIESLDVRRLLIVPDGALHIVPFSALPLPRPGGGGRRPSAPTPLIARYEVVSAPSGSIVHLLRRERAGRPAPFKAVAVFADPVFDVDDSRVPRQAQPGVTKAAGAPTPRLDLRRAAVDIGLTADDVHFGRLPYTRTEATAIRRMVSPAPVLTALDFAASRATAISGSLRDFRIVHFATHAIVDAVHPELSGIVLSLVDEQGGDQDGFLRLQDIYNLDLAAELVVLSACRTGLGREVRGEGFLGLTRAFMYAGASRVVVSLWKIEDQATAHLMELFYRYMFRNRLEPEAALRAAQLEMSRQPRWRSPYFWAGFVLSGDWRPLPRQ